MPDSEPLTHCAICALENVDDDAVVFRDDLWAAEINPGYDVPGWFVLRARRHAERITGLNSAESGRPGRSGPHSGGRHRGGDRCAERLPDVVRREPCSFPFSGHRADRGRSAGRHGGDILKLRAEAQDPAATRALVPRIRAAYRTASRTDRS